jgi:UDP-GlcNAc3NAcA epimerase
MKIVSVLGARPQFIKASVVSSAIARAGAMTEVVVHTGQHFDANMSEVFFEELGMRPPEYHLGVRGGTHGAMTGRMLAKVERVLLAERPDVVLVYGDTNSTLAGALAAVKLHIPVAHVEAGLRSFNMAMPEEVNRIITDRVSRLLFTPTAAAARNLRQEGVAEDLIERVGDVMYDVALHHGARAETRARALQRLDVAVGEYVLVTIHRAENTDNPLRLGAIVDAILEIASERPVVWPVHPRTRQALKALGRARAVAERLLAIEPVGYLDMVQLERHAALIATDSGGVQKEAFFHQVPCVTLRDETEWVELLEAGWNRLTPPVSAASVAGAIRASLGTRGLAVRPYGDGNAAELIASRLTRLA